QHCARLAVLDHAASPDLGILVGGRAPAIREPDFVSAGAGAVFLTVGSESVVALRLDGCRRQRERPPLASETPLPERNRLHLARCSLSGLLDGTGVAAAELVSEAGPDWRPDTDPQNGSRQLMGDASARSHQHLRRIRLAHVA